MTRFRTHRRPPFPRVPANTDSAADLAELLVLGAENLFLNGQPDAARFRKAALDLEHAAEFNVNETFRWSERRRIANNRLINLSRQLHARADELEIAEGD